MTILTPVQKQAQQQTRDMIRDAKERAVTTLVQAGILRIGDTVPPALATALDIGIKAGIEAAVASINDPANATRLRQADQHRIEPVGAPCPECGVRVRGVAVRMEAWVVLPCGHPTSYRPVTTATP